MPLTLLNIFAAPFKSKSRLEAENAALRHQLIVLRRKVRGQVRLTNSDRWFLIQLYRWFPSILDVDLVWINVITNPTAEWIARQLTEAFPWGCTGSALPHPRLGSDLRQHCQTPKCAMGIRDKPTAPASPWQNGLAEQLVGSIRRECVDHFIVLGEAHLRRILRAYAGYYNDIRTQRSLDKDAPVYRPVQRTGNNQIEPHP